MTRITSPSPLPIRPKDGNKGTFGRVLIVGGSEGMLGAPSMAGRSALKLGSGLVEIAVPRSILVAALTITPELIGIGLETGVPEELKSAAEKAAAIVIGPGLGQSTDAFDRLKAMTQLTKPMVVDADGLNMLAAQVKWPDWFKATAVLTPHPGEMKRLAKLIGRDTVPTDDAGRIDIAMTAAKSFGQTIVLKGNRTVVTDGQRVYINHTGDSSLSKAGTGDVLSGMIGCLLGQKINGFDAATAAVHLHGRAGEIAGEQLGLRCVLAHDVINAIPQAVREYETLYG
jgi:ADP-dependent NAD(P)H-hydrate dehydratase